MSKATEASLSASRKKRQELAVTADEKTNRGAHTSGSSFVRRSGLKKSSYGKGSSYSQ